MAKSTNKIKNGTKRTIKGKPCVYYDGYWIRRYELQTDNLATKKRTIDQLTRRVFHHVEPGINTPGNRYEEIKKTYLEETEPKRKRVKGAMLAGALLNRGKDILTTIVELEQAGIKIKSDNELLRECGTCFLEALKLGKNIKLSNGGEGLDELWGEPFKAFSMHMEEFYVSRYIKVAQTMAEIDQITSVLLEISNRVAGFNKAKPIIRELAKSAKLACETLRSDPVIFEVWPCYISAKEALEEFVPEMPDTNGTRMDQAHEMSLEFKKRRIALDLIMEGGKLLMDLSTVRVPMPNSTKKFMEICNKFIE